MVAGSSNSLKKYRAFNKITILCIIGSLNPPIENYGGAKEVQYEWERHIGSKNMVNESA
jgi:hypothetical protein